MRKINSILLAAVALLWLSSCSTTKHIPDDDQLFIGLKPIEYVGDITSDHAMATQEEVEAALATAPNAALFGSSYYRSPLPIGLWIWNACDGSYGKIKKWLNKSFGTQPVLMSKVNPTLRATVARNVLRNNGYMHGSVSFEEIPQKNPKKVKVAYKVKLDSLFHIDTLQYAGFPADMQHLIDSMRWQTLLPPNSPFTTSLLDGERNRLATLFRNNGYYYYSPGLASYLADTFAVANRAKLRLQLADSLPSSVLRPWHIGQIRISLRQNMSEQLSDSSGRRFIKIFYNGKRPPIRPTVVMRNMRLRPRYLFNYDDYLESVQNVNAIGIFSQTDFSFTPRADGSDTLDLNLDCIFDKPYDFYVETNVQNRTIGRMGPEIRMGITMRNILHYGEKIDANAHGSYEWTTNGTGSDMNTFQYGADLSIEFPRIIAPFVPDRRAPKRDKNGNIIPRKYYSTPWTIAKVSTDVIRRPEYYKMHIVSGELTYRWQNTAYSKHEFSPLTVTYQFANSHTAKFDELIANNSYLQATMGDVFIPKMRYTYTYHYTNHPNSPLRWETTVSEAGNVSSLFFLAKGKGWLEKDKKMFKNPYSQFVRIETDVTKTWKLDLESSFVAHASAGIIWLYGNSSFLPFSEGFYVGGANSIRAFEIRSIGPGAFPGTGDKSQSYLMQNGTSKLVLNFEYRRRLFGNLHGAIFFDAGNVWKNNSENKIDITDDMTPEARANAEHWNTIMDDCHFKGSRLWKDLATGTGIGLRYDLDFLILRVDWGIALHAPYNTGKEGYFNFSRFRDMHTLHFAIGYPF